MTSLFRKVAIVGPGLIGGSIGIGLRERDLAEEVIGIGRRQSSLDKAIKAGAIDDATTDVAEGCANADLVILATPIGTFETLARELAQCMKGGAILSEVGSTKQDVIKTISRELAERKDITFIPTHPMAGSEKRGPEHATSTLFENSTCIFTPLPDTPPQHIQNLKSMWQKLGARVHTLSPEVHDELIARVSHLPHISATALMDCVAEEDIRYAGTGFEDTTRIASGDPTIWCDICKSNAPEIISSIDRFISSLSNARELLSKGRFADLEEWLKEAKQKRDRSLAPKETDTTH